MGCAGDFVERAFSRLDGFLVFTDRALQIICKHRK